MNDISTSAENMDCFVDAVIQNGKLALSMLAAHQEPAET